MLNKWNFKFFYKNVFTTIKSGLKITKLHVFETNVIISLTLTFLTIFVNYYNTVLRDTNNIRVLLWMYLIINIKIFKVHFSEDYIEKY